MAEAEVPFKNFYFNYFYMYEKNYRRNGGVYDMDKEKVRQLVKEYSKLVVANMIVNKIILYGSYARGNAREDTSGFLNDILEYGEVVYSN